MPEKDNELRMLAEKMTLLLDQVADLKGYSVQSQKALQESIKAIMQRMERIAGEAEATRKAFEERVLYQSLALGLVLGVLGGFFVSYFMKVLELLNVQPWGWALAVVAAALAVFAILWLFNKRIREAHISELP